MVGGVAHATLTCWWWGGLLDLFLGGADHLRGVLVIGKKFRFEKKVTKDSQGSQTRDGNVLRFRTTVVARRSLEQSCLLARYFREETNMARWSA